MKKISNMILAVLLAMSVVLSGCAQQAVPPASEQSGSDAAPQEKEAPIIGFCNHSSISYFADMGASAHKAASEAGSEFYELRYDGEASKQVTIIEDLISKGTKILLCEIAVADQAVEYFKELKEQGVIIVCIDINCESDYWIASDDFEIGRTSGRDAVEYLTEKYGEPKGTVAMLSHKTATNMANRCNGFREIMDEYPNIKIIDERFPSDFDANLMMNLTDDILQVYGTGELDVIFASNQTQAEGANAAIVSAKRQDVALFGVDDSEAIREALADPNSTLMSTVTQNPVDMGRQAVEMGLQIYQGNIPAETTYRPPVTLVTRNNLQQFIEDMDAVSAALKEFYQ